MKKYSIENKYIKLITLDYGATVHQLITKDKNGDDVNVVMGFENLEDYRNNSGYIGASVGRFAGRIRKEGYHINNNHYDVYTENNVHLHGGKEGFSFKKWTLESIENGEEPSIKFSYLSPDKEEGYPGNLKVLVTYKLVENQFIIIYEATTDQDTIVNLTNHNYYNLNGNGTILNHELQINAEHILSKDADAIPTGDFTSVENSHFDFRTTREIGSTFEFKGIDDTYVLKENNPLAILHSKQTGIEMEVASNQPGVVIYTPEKMNEDILLNKPLETYPSICFETEKFSDAPNHPHFPSTHLKKGDVYKNETTFTFRIK
ncbi:aldose epimerase family protein [Joostella sp. CR20]|uniref:aldose epimerase family protein n=1 Tax=Joostella sp. CR20 TaxID=2804312 RepID=UPI00313AE47F